MGATSGGGGGYNQLGNQIGSMLGNLSGDGTGYNQTGNMMGGGGAGGDMTGSASNWNQQTGDAYWTPQRMAQTQPMGWGNGGGGGNQIGGFSGGGGAGGGAGAGGGMNNQAGYGTVGMNGGVYNTGGGYNPGAYNQNQANQGKQFVAGRWVGGGGGGAGGGNYNQIGNAGGGALGGLTGGGNTNQTGNMMGGAQSASGCPPWNPNCNRSSGGGVAGSSAAYNKPVAAIAPSGGGAGGWGGGTQIGASDERLKENIREMNDPLELVRKIRAVKYDWKEGGAGAGVTAQNVAEALPEAVVTMPDGHLAVDGLALVGALIGAVNALADRLEALSPA